MRTSKWLWRLLSGRRYFAKFGGRRFERGKVLVTEIGLSIYIYTCVYIYICIRIFWIDAYCRYFFTQVCIAYINDICTYMYIFTSQFIYTIPRHAYTIHTTPILGQTSHTFSADVCCRCPGLFCTTSSKGPEGMGFDGWIGEISRRWWTQESGKKMDQGRNLMVTLVGYYPP